MANDSKFIRHGETYCGDGTTSAAATSNGGVGAWNNINVLTGTAPAYGALAAGTDVYIRSKDASGANLAISSSTAINVGSSAAAAANPITWVIDAGSVWAGISGTLTVTTTAAGIGVNVINYNNLIATDYNMIFASSVASFGNAPFFTANKCNTHGIKIDSSANVTSGAFGGRQSFLGGTHMNTWIRQGQVTYAFIFGDRDLDTTLINPKIELLGPLYFANASTAVFDPNTAVSTKFSIYGGEIISSFAGLNLVRTSSFGLSHDFYGLKYPSVMNLSTPTLYPYVGSVSVTGSDGAVGCSYYDSYYSYSSRADGYYPTLNAQLELSVATPWSYSIYPFGTTQQQPAKLTTSKIWTQAAATKTVTMEFLWPTSMAAPTSGDVWMTVGYTDSATGNKVSQSTMAYPKVACASSSAAWSATTYGATLFNKYKLSLTTLSSIKQDTAVMVTFHSAPASGSVNDIIIVCPDVVLN